MKSIRHKIDPSKFPLFFRINISVIAWAHHFSHLAQVAEANIPCKPGSKLKDGNFLKNFELIKIFIKFWTFRTVQPSEANPQSSASNNDH
jgi:hypothetical protein